MNDESRLAVKLFAATYGEKPTRLFVSGGRLEIIGNHTDHNHGLCLVAGCSMGISAAVEPLDEAMIEIVSAGFPDIRTGAVSGPFDAKEYGTSLGLVHGIVAGLVSRGYAVGGFRAALHSDVFPGAGVSSSAAYECLIVKILSALYNHDAVTPLDMAEIGQFAENRYFGKPSGLLDQIGSSFGNIDYLDFLDTANPIVQPLNFTFPLHIVLVNGGASHADLTPLYASIPSDMFSVAQKGFNQPYLRLVDEKSFEQGISRPIDGISERAKLRAQHFYDENKRVIKARDAILALDQASFLEQIRGSSLSSSTLLGNTMANGIYEKSPQQALDRANRLIGAGACRIMGGGFAGSIICFVPDEGYASFLDGMREFYGEAAVIEVAIRQGGPSEAVL